MRTHRVRCYFIGEHDELLAISSRLLSPQAAKRLAQRLKQPDSDLLDVEVYNARRPPPLQDGVRQIVNLEEFANLTARLADGEEGHR